MINGFVSYWKFRGRTDSVLTPDMFTKLLSGGVCLRGGVRWRAKNVARSHPRSKARSIVSLGREGWQWWRIDVPLRRRREGRLWKPPVSWWYAYALNTDGCRVVSGMCQEPWIDSDISEITFMVHFYGLLCIINFTRRSVEWHSCCKQDFPEFGLGGWIQERTGLKFIVMEGNFLKLFEKCLSMFYGVFIWKIDSVYNKIWFSGSLKTSHERQARSWRRYSLKADFAWIGHLQLFAQ